MAKWDFPKPPFPREFFEKVRAAKPEFKRIKKFVVQPHEGGRAFIAKKGQTVRIICVEGPQIADVCFWNAKDPKERFWNDMTINREGIFVTTYSRLWSNMPKFRPMMTIIEDTVPNTETHPGARHHYIFGAHCNPHIWYYVTGDKSHPNVTTYNCYYNLLRAIDRYGLRAEDLHGNINLFMKCYIDPETSLHPVEPCEARKGDYVEFYAEMDVLVAFSICPSGSGADHLNILGKESKERPKPLGVEIYDTGIEPPKYEDPFEA